MSPLENQAPGGAIKNAHLFAHSDPFDLEYEYLHTAQKQPKGKRLHLDARQEWKNNGALINQEVM